jgi:hypothetical protein
MPPDAVLAYSLDVMARFAHKGVRQAFGMSFAPYSA